MLMLAKRRIVPILIICSAFFVSAVFGQIRISHIAVIDSVRNDSIVTLLSEELLEQNSYQIFSEDEEIGTLAVLSSDQYKNRKGYSYRTLGRYSIRPGKESMFRAGDTVALILEKEKINVTYPDNMSKEVRKYKQRITTHPDGREMVFIKGGRSWIGCDSGEKTEYPRHEVILDPYYMDTYEVSNSDYNLFVKKSGGKLPLSWNGSYPADRADFPVLVTYYEALAYAKWTGKELPSESHWEMAANGNQAEKKVVTRDGMMDVIETTVYPWGNSFNNENTNCVDFWINRDLFMTFSKGYLPVTSLADKDVSAYGVVNMAGNAAEWTSSWFDSYAGSKYKNSRYGKQVKVIRGGSYFSSSKMTRISSRDFGGIPNLYSDHCAGFRCLKRCDITDIEK